MFDHPGRFSRRAWLQVSSKIVGYSPSAHPSCPLTGRFRALGWEATSVDDAAPASDLEHIILPEKPEATSKIVAFLVLK